MLSKAHRESAEFAPDPLYSVQEKKPLVLAGAGVWLYGHYEWEAFILERMFREKNEAKLKVGYTKFRRVPAAKGFFKKCFEKGESFTFRATGKVNLLLNGKTFCEFPPSDQEHSLLLPEKGEVILALECEDVEKELPSLWIPEGKEKWL